MPSSKPTLEKAIEHLLNEVGSLLAKLEIKVDVVPEHQQDGLYLNFKGDDQNRLKDQRGDIVKALAVVFQAFWDHHFPEFPKEIRCDVDSEGQQQEAELKKVAFNAVGNLKNPGDHVDIGPFNSYERRLIHLSLKEWPNVNSQSLGEGHQKMMRLTMQETSGS